MSVLVALSVGFARTWVGLYTLGLPSMAREVRRSEIESDLWEQQWLASRRGDSAFATAGEIATRTLFGVIDDISWRLESGASPRKKGMTVNDRMPMRIGFLLVMLPLALLIVNGVAIAIFGAGDFNNSTEHFLWGLAFLVCPLVTAVGMVLCSKVPRLGFGMVVVGAMSTALLMFWMAMITVPLALIAIIFAAFRAGYLPRPSRQQPA
jgi:hypothetical protein